VDVAADTDTTSIERELLIHAPPDEVWELLVDPRHIIRWMGQAASFDPRPGGSWRIDVIPGHTTRGKVLEVEPPHRLVYTWGWDGSEAVPPGSSTVVFELIPRGKGTVLRLRHHGLPNADAIASHTHGWSHYFERLVALSAGREPGVDPWISEYPKRNR
jgi:uncharacterized protein YndB with AHSA1/START domain